MVGASLCSVFSFRSLCSLLVLIGCDALEGRNVEKQKKKTYWLFAIQTPTTLTCFGAATQLYWPLYHSPWVILGQILKYASSTHCIKKYISSDLDWSMRKRSRQLVPHSVGRTEEGHCTSHEIVWFTVSQHLQMDSLLVLFASWWAVPGNDLSSFTNTKAANFPMNHCTGLHLTLLLVSDAPPSTWLLLNLGGFHSSSVLSGVSELPMILRLLCPECDWAARHFNQTASA